MDILPQSILDAFFQTAEQIGQDAALELFVDTYPYLARELKLLWLSLNPDVEPFLYFDQEEQILDLDCEELIALTSSEMNLSF